MPVLNRHSFCRGQKNGSHGSAVGGSRVFEVSPHFNEDEKLVLRLAVELTRTPANVCDALYEALRQRFSERELVELTGVIAWENYRARFNRRGGRRFLRGTILPFARKVKLHTPVLKLRAGVCSPDWKLQP